MLATPLGAGLCPVALGGSQESLPAPLRILLIAAAQHCVSGQPHCGAKRLATLFEGITIHGGYTISCCYATCSSLCHSSAISSLLKSSFGVLTDVAVQVLQDVLCGH